MANFPAGAIYIWAGTNATIPSGWERVTALDGKYPKGTANETDPNDTGGNATHTHTGTTHSHTMDSHTHSTTIGNHPTNQQPADGSISYSYASHTHNSGSITSGASSGGGLSEVACTYASVANDPPYYTVIFITPTTSVSYFPQNAVYLYDGSDSKTGHYLCNGSNSTPNLVGKYLKGAGTGANAGGTGGSTTNVHDLTHTHTVASHTHANVTTGQPNATGDSSNTTSGDILKPHTHTISYSSTTATISSTAPKLTTTETVEPAYTKLLTVQNQNTGSGSYRLGMIGMWVGTLASIPSNYTLCDGTNGTQDMRGKHLKSTATTGDIGNTGGSNTHTHVAQNHTHTASATHTHTASGGIHTGVSVGGGSGDDEAKSDNTSSSHTLTVSSAAATYANASTTGDSQNNEPEYRTVAFIKLAQLSTGSAFFLNFL